MINILFPTFQEIQKIQDNEKTFYWSRCAENLFRKHGVVCVGTGNQNLENYMIVTRQHRLSEVPYHRDLSGFMEGPLHSEIAKRFGVNVQFEQPVDVLYLYQANGTCIGSISYPKIRLKKISNSFFEKSASSFIFDPKDNFYNNQTIFWQSFHQQENLEPVLYANSGTCHAKKLVVVRKNNLLLCGLPILDILCNGHGCPPLPEAYYNCERSAPNFRLEKEIIEIIIRHLQSLNKVLIRMKTWPKGFDSAFTLRHDYDRKISFFKQYRLMKAYQRNNIKCSWGFLDTKLSKLQSKLLKKYKHEINLHSQAPTLEKFQKELNKVAKVTQSSIRGFTTHGGYGARGWLGNTHFNWAKECQLNYSEILGRHNGLPHPVNWVQDNGIPEISSVMVPACHLSLDAGLKKDQHYLKEVLNLIPDRLTRGEHVVLMSHPDIHVPELLHCLEKTVPNKTWKASLYDVVHWASLIHFKSTAEICGEDIMLHFDHPLPMDAIAELIKGSTVREIPLSKGRNEYQVREGNVL